MKRSLLLVVLIGGGCLLNACGGSANGSSHQGATHFLVVPSSATSTVGEPFYFTVTALDASNNLSSRAATPRPVYLQTLVYLWVVQTHSLRILTR